MPPEPRRDLLAAQAANVAALPSYSECAGCLGGASPTHAAAALATPGCASSIRQHQHVATHSAHVIPAEPTPRRPPPRSRRRPPTGTDCRVEPDSPAGRARGTQPPARKVCQASIGVPSGPCCGRAASPGHARRLALTRQFPPAVRDPLCACTRCHSTGSNRHRCHRRCPASSPIVSRTHPPLPRCQAPVLRAGHPHPAEPVGR